MNIKFLYVTLFIFFVGCHDENGEKCTDKHYRGNPVHSPLAQLPYSDKPEIPHDQVLPADIIEKLNDTMESMVESTGVTGITVSVGVPGQGVWVYKGGVINQTSQIPVTASTPFWWMSIGKMFTAAIIFQLIEEGKLSLDASIEPWFPELVYAGHITIDDLLKHTSGLYSFQEDERIINLDHYLPPDQLLSMAFEHQPLFCPGQYWAYSNTGYVMLAKIIESITGEAYANIIQSRILLPLDMKNTKVSGVDIPSDIAWGHTDNKLPAPVFLPNLPFGAGNIISTSPDMLIFVQAFFRRDLFSDATLLAALRQLYPMYDNGLYYGRGIMLFDVKNENAELLWVGHTGGSQFSNAIVALDINSGVIVAVSINDKTPATAVALQLFEVIKK